MPARVDRIADPFATTGRGDIRKILACRRALLLELVQYICSRLFQEWSPLLAHLDRVDEFNATRDVWHVTDYVQRRALTPSPLEIEAECLGQLQLRYSQIVLGSNQLRNLAVQLHVCLQHVEPWNSARLKPILLVLQLSFQKTHVFFVHTDELTIDDDLVELRFHRGDQ